MIDRNKNRNIEINTNSYYALGLAAGKADAMGSAQISYTYHQHSSTCYKSCTVTHSVSASYQVEGGWYRTNTWRHSSCGQRTQTSTENVTAYGYTEAGSSTSTHQYLICGKSTTTPISATITF